MFSFARDQGYEMIMKNKIYWEINFFFKTKVQKDEKFESTILNLLYFDMLF